MFDRTMKDLIYGARRLARERAFTLTTVATLTVALALVTVVFAVFNAYVLRPYAVRDPYSLYEIRWSARQGSAGSAGRTFRWADYQELRERTDLFDDVIGERNQSVMFGSRPLLVAFVTGNYFQMLGGRVLAGRALAAFDAQLGADPVAVLSHDAWTRLSDRDPAIVGQTIRLNDQLVTIVGVMQDEFLGLNDTPPDAWLPVTMHAAVMKQDLFAAKQPRELAVIARLRSGVTAQQVASALSPEMAHLSERQGTVRAEVLPQATPAPLTAGLLARLSPVFAAFALVLIAACANVSNVMLARANSQQREIGIRLALGAGRSHVVRQLLVEGVLIAAIAGATALALASLILRAGLAIFFMTLPPSFAAVARVLPLEVDHRVFVFTLIVAALATIMFALLPALHGTRLTLTSALRGELSAGVRGSRLRNGLVISQVAVSLVLVIVATTIVRNGSALRKTDVGFDTQMLASITPRGASASSQDAFARAYAALAASPHLAQVAVTSHNPLTGELPLSPIRMPHGRAMVPVSYMYVSPEYFATVQIPIERGRAFRVDEARTESKVAIVSAAAARALWPNADPLARTVRVWMPPEDRPDVMTHDRLLSTAQIEREGDDVVVIGVAKDVVSGLVYDGRRPHLYLPTSAGARHARALLVRARSIADTRTDRLQSALHTVDPSPLAFTILPLAEALALQTFPMTIASWIGLLLSGIALALSVSGLYGVVTYGLSQRVKEIGIRIALGATPAAIMQLVMMQAGRLVAVGCSLGLLVSFSALGLLAAIVSLQNVSILDFGAFTVGTAVVALAAVTAAFFPSRTATRIDPVCSLRADQ